MGKIAVLFPGQGSQYAGMLRRFLDEPAVGRVLDQAERTLGLDFRNMFLDGDRQRRLGTDIVQPLIYVASVALCEYLEDRGELTPDFAAGHSLGEYAALTFAGSLAFEDGLLLVSERGRLMAGMSDGARASMAAINGLDDSTVREICREAARKRDATIAVACYNSPSQHVVSGEPDVVSVALELAREKGGQGMPLPVSGPFHSALMKPAADRFREVLSKYRFAPPRIPVISNRTAVPFEPERIAEHLAEQLTEPVLWSDTIAYLQNAGVDCFLEIGPKDVLRNMIRRSYPGMNAYAVDRTEDERHVAELVRSKEPDIPAFLMACIRAAVSTRNDNRDDEAYKEGVIKPYRKLQQLWNDAEQGKTIGDEEIDLALRLTLQIWETKQVGEDEQTERLNELASLLGSKKPQALAAVRKGVFC